MAAVNLNLPRRYKYQNINSTDDGLAASFNQWRVFKAVVVQYSYTSKWDAGSEGGVGCQ